MVIAVQLLCAARLGKCIELRRFLFVDLKELAGQYKARFLETSTELCHNLDELLVELTLTMRKERMQRNRSRKSSIKIV